ncbi:BPSL0067 family protein [Photobacterium japonica]
MQWYTKVGKASTWVEGIPVRGNRTKIRLGTAIATFVDGKYPNKRTGNHAALYISQFSGGIWVMDQWASENAINARLIKFKGRNADGSYVDPSNNADAFSVIMHE